MLKVVSNSKTHWPQNESAVLKGIRESYPNPAGAAQGTNPKPKAPLERCHTGRGGETAASGKDGVEGSVGGGGGGWAVA